MSKTIKWYAFVCTMILLFAGEMAQAMFKVGGIDDELMEVDAGETKHFHAGSTGIVVHHPLLKGHAATQSAMDIDGADPQALINWDAKILGEMAQAMFNGKNDESMEVSERDTWDYLNPQSNEHMKENIRETKCFHASSTDITEYNPLLERHAATQREMAVVEADREVHGWDFTPFNWAELFSCFFQYLSPAAFFSAVQAGSGYSSIANLATLISEKQIAAVPTLTDAKFFIYSAFSTLYDYHVKNGLIASPGFELISQINTIMQPYKEYSIIVYPFDLEQGHIMESALSIYNSANIDITQLSLNCDSVALLPAETEMEYEIVGSSLPAVNGKRVIKGHVRNVIIAHYARLLSTFNAKELAPYFFSAHVISQDDLENIQRHSDTRGFKNHVVLWVITSTLNCDYINMRPLQELLDIMIEHGSMDEQNLARKIYADLANPYANLSNR